MQRGKRWDIARNVGFIAEANAQNSEIEAPRQLAAISLISIKSQVKSSAKPAAFLMDEFVQH
jgi:hypothetical protein